MAEIILMTEEQKFKLEIYRLSPKSNSAAEEVFASISTDQLKLELFKLHYSDSGANPNLTSRTIEVVCKLKKALDLFAIGA